MYGHKIRVIIPSYNCRRHKKPNGAIVLLIFGEVDISRTLSIKRGLGSSCALVPKWLKAFKSKVTICMQQHENIRHQLFIKVWGRWRRSRTQKSFYAFLMRLVFMPLYFKIVASRVPRKKMHLVVLWICDRVFDADLQSRAETKKVPVTLVFIPIL